MAKFEWIYICGYKVDSCNKKELGEADKKVHKNEKSYMVTWSRFGNIKLEK